MNRERWQQVKQLLAEAIAIGDVELPSFLDRACQGDADLRREVESLLSSHHQAGAGFLREPAADLSGAAAAAAPARERRLGAYQIKEEIGHGGMGEVYRAVRVDGQYTKEVAIKMVRGGIESRSLAERFRNERQILASLDHPNIALLLDGGATDDGVPYLVMELIRGVPIDQYCDDHSLAISERLQLFRQACEAVQYAHQRLVIHRDIKPSNILVTDEGAPKLLDFGLAKLLDPSGNTGVTMMQAMTPEYASPEQIRGEIITTASDVYSLGVVLYRLLTGRSPYAGDTATPHGLAHAICDNNPIRPSTAVSRTEHDRNDDGASPVIKPISSKREDSPARLRRRLAGDLDNVVMRALHKETSQRYASVEQLSNDLQRHLEGLPVSARPDSWIYRAGKFAKRHKLGLAASILIFIVLLGGVMTTLREARIAAANEQRAQKRFNDVRKLGDSLIFEIHDSVRDLPGSTPARQLIVNRALEYLDNLSQQATGDVALQRELAAAYIRVGDVLGYAYGPNLGDKPGALKSYRKAATILEPLASASPDDERLQRDLADCSLKMTNVLDAAGEFENALSSAERSVTIMQRVTAAHKDPELLDRLAGAYYFRADVLSHMGNNEGALENYQQAVSILEGALRTDPSLRLLRTHLAGDYAGLALAMSKKGQMTQAITEQAKVVGMIEESFRMSPNNAELREYLGEAIDRLAEFQLNAKDAAAALQAANQGHEIFRELLRADPKNSLAKENFGFSDLHVAGALLLMGKPASTLAVFQEAAATFESMSPRTSGDRYIRTGLALSYSGLGRAHADLASARGISGPARQTEWLQARDWYEKSLSLWSDKNKRGEVERSEHEDENRAAQGLERCNRALAAMKSSGSDQPKSVSDERPRSLA